MSAIVVLTTVPDSRTGQKIAQALVRKKLAACVSMSGGLRSVYHWKGKVQSARETLLIIKTSRSLFSKLEHALKITHPYESPEIIALPITAGSKKYLSWLESSVR